MNSGFIIFASFVAGVGIGVFAADRWLDRKYEARMQEEVDSVKEAFRNAKPLPDLAPRNKPDTTHPTAEQKREYAMKVHELGYAEKQTAQTKMVPFVIAPEVFGADDEYDKISLTYYLDGTVADDSDRPMDDDDIEETIGKESLTHFGEYEDDSVYVQNDRLHVYYEILMDHRNYADVLKEHPYLRQ